MKILYDHQIFTLQRLGGISRYFRELIFHFNSMEDIDVEIPLMLSNNRYLSETKIIKHINLFPNKQFRGKRRLFNFVNKLNSVSSLKNHNYDIFHPTYYDPYFLKYIDDKPFVLTLHDMIHEKFRGMISKKDRTSLSKRLLVEKATKIIAVSESTKRDLIELFGTNDAKIEVVYHGYSMFPKSDINLSLDIPKKYLLFVGGRSSYKNFERLTKSISHILKQDREVFLLCTGGGKFSSREKKLFVDLEISKQVLQYDLDDDGLAYFYKNALAFVFPSLYEGFGIPVLESFACGCPVLCSNAGSLPEVAGDAALYFDPYSEASIRNAVLKVLGDTIFREDLINKGYEQLKKFSWAQTAEKTKKIYESVIK